VALKPDVIYSQGLPATLALRQSTTTIPVVFTQLIDPVGFGLAEGLGHPGGNVTGFVVRDFAIAGKWVQLMHELMPDLTEVGVLFNPDTAPYAPGLISAAKQADRGVQIVECRTHNDAETEAVLSDFARERAARPVQRTGRPRWPKGGWPLNRRGLLLFGGFQRRLSLANNIAPGTDEYVQDSLFRSNEGRPRPSHRDIAGTADRRGGLFY
jgi:ABC transporter substrate binding protein